MTQATNRNPPFWPDTESNIGALQEAQVAERIESAAMTRLLLGVASTVVILAGMHVAADIVAPVLLAWVIAVSMTPLLNWLIGRGLSTRVSQLLVVLAVVVFLVALVLILGISLSRLMAAIPTYGENLTALKMDIAHTAANMSIDLSDFVGLDLWNAERVVRLASRVAGNVGSAVTTSGITIVVAMFMLLEATTFPQIFRKAVKSESVVSSRIGTVNHEIRQYMIIMTWSGLFVGIANTALLLLIGVDFAVLWGFVSFLMSYVPAIGFVIATIPPSLLALLEFGWREAFFVVVGYSLIRVVIFSVLKPRYAAQKLDISRVVVIIAVIFFVWLLGPMGSILAVPLAVVIKDLVLASSEDTRPVSILMGAGTVNLSEDDKRSGED
jgi:AI-2 transport protein TqsA